MSGAASGARSWTLFPSVSRRRGGHSKKRSLARLYLCSADNEVQWDMLCGVQQAVPAAGRAAPDDDHPAAPAWFSGDAATGIDALPAPPPPPVPAYADMRLPFELWIAIFAHLDDGYDIHALARVSRGLCDVAQDAIARHAAYVAQRRIVHIHSHELESSSPSSASALLALGPRAVLAVRDVHIHRKVGADRRVPTGVARALAAFPNVRSLTLHVGSNSSIGSSSSDEHDLGARWSDARLATVPLPHLRAFSTTLAYTPDVARFVRAHRTIEDLAINGSGFAADVFEDPTAVVAAGVHREADAPLPRLRTLACGLRGVAAFSASRTLTHLHVLVHVPRTLETVAGLLGQQLVSLRLGVLERLPGPRDAQDVWSAQDFLVRFPRLRYVELHMFELGFTQYPIQWSAPESSPSDSKRRTPGRSGPGSDPSPEASLTVAWVLAEDAWGTLLDPREPDQIRQLFEAVACDVLRGWGPRVARVVYGDAGVPDTAVRLGAGGEGVVREEDAVLGEDYWKRV